MFFLMSYGILGAMMNEILFLLHTFFVLIVVCGAVFLGQHAMQALVCVYTVLANLFIVKKMVLLGFVASGSDVYIVGSMCGLMIGGVLWGQQFARQTAALSVATSLFFWTLCWFQVAYAPLPVDSMHDTFALLLSRMPYITFFSIAAHYCAQVVTVTLSAQVRALMRGLWQMFGLIGAMVLGQILDGVMFFGGAFGVATPWATLLQMIAVSLLVKMFGIIAGSALIMGVVWCKERGYVQ